MGEHMTKSVTRFPVSESKRIENRLGPMAVPCQVSDRWLDFDRESALLAGGEFIGVRVMTRGTGDQPRKLCSMYITRERLLEVLGKVTPKDD